MKQLGWSFACALAACGDDAALAPDAAATVDAAPPSCDCTYEAPMVVGTVGAPAVELSGLAASRALPVLWTHNDSDSVPRVIALSAATGATVGELALTGAPITDWEDLALGPCSGGAGTCLFLGDIGDNNLVRPRVRIYEIDEPSTPSSGTGTFRTFELAYPDGAHNSEALFVDPRDGAAYVIGKQTARPTPVYRMPLIAGTTAVAELVGTFAVPAGSSALVTAADFFVDGCDARLLVRTYDGIFELRGAPDATIASLLAAAPVRGPVPPEIQGEAIAYEPGGRAFYTTTEGTDVPLHLSRCR